MVMERKLNPSGWAWFKYLNKREKTQCKISIAQYWDLLYYVDDDYLTDWEVLQMKRLYRWQL